jgi:hypothetical protein
LLNGDDMAVSIFDDKSVTPDNDMVAVVLADAYSLWEELQNHIQCEYPNVAGEWKHYGKAAGWSFLLKSKKRTLIYLVPNNGYFRIRVVLGEKAVACAESSELPNDIKEAIRAATPYVEGRSIDIDISRNEQLETVKNLLKIKFEN